MQSLPPVNMSERAPNRSSLHSLEILSDDGEAEAGLSGPIVERGGQEVLSEVVVQVVTKVQELQG